MRWQRALCVVLFITSPGVWAGHWPPRAEDPEARLVRGVKDCRHYLRNLVVSGAVATVGGVGMAVIAAPIVAAGLLIGAPYVFLSLTSNSPKEQVKPSEPTTIEPSKDPRKPEPAQSAEELIEPAKQLPGGPR